MSIFELKKFHVLGTLAIKLAPEVTLDDLEIYLSMYQKEPTRQIWSKSVDPSKNNAICIFVAV